MALHAAVRRALELAEQCSLESEIPCELKEAVRYCVASGIARIRPVYAVLPSRPTPGSHPSRSESLFRDHPLILPAPKEYEHQFPLRLLLLDKGRAALAEDRINDAPPSETATELRSEQPTNQASTTAQPKKLLTGWHEIAAALEMKHADRERIKSLNRRFNGPIINNGTGTRPMVYRDELIVWWDWLAIQAQESENRHAGAKRSAEAQHNYGRSGTAAPEIGGGVKKRRRDRKT